MDRSKIVALVIVSPLVLALSACSHDKRPAKAPAPAEVTRTHAPHDGKAQQEAKEGTIHPVSTQADDTGRSGMISISDEIRRPCAIADADVFFSFDSTKILSKDIKPLDQVVECLTKGPLKGHAMRLVGHADRRGGAEYNLVLGQRRADAVEFYVDRKGMTPSKVETTTRGSMDATGHDEPGWAWDRRVDLLLSSR